MTQAARQNAPHRRPQASSLSQQIGPGLSAGLLIGLLSVVYALSYGVLICSGSLAAYVPVGIGLTLFSAAVIGLITALGSSFPATIAGPQGKPVAVLALISTSIAATMGPVAAVGLTADDKVWATAVVALMIAALLTGLLFLLLGLFNLGGLIRFIPYPVMGGFMAGSGWLLVKGAVKVMAGVPLELAQLGRLAQADVLALWLPGLIFALILLLLLRRIKHYLVLPAMILLGAAIFYLVLWLSGISPAEAVERGWLMNPLTSGSLWPPLSPATLLQADWSVILGQAGNLATALVISVISVLLTTSSLELAAGQDIDLNRELKASGLANLLAGAGGGMLGYHSLGSSTLAHRMGARTRLPGLVSALVCASMLWWGGRVIGWFPRPLLGALIMLTGLDFLVEWVYDARRKLPRSDYGVVLLILAVVGLVGFLEGIAVGVVAGMVLFVIKYSRVDVIKHTLSAATFQSHVERGEYHRQVLSEQGQHIYILKLQGYIFFGTAAQLYAHVRQRLNAPDLPPLRFLVLDFRLVSGLDSSALNSFARIMQLLQAQQAVLVLTDLPPTLQHQFSQGGLEDESDNTLRYFADLDRGIEWCENRILKQQDVTLIMFRQSLRDRFKRVCPPGTSVERLLDYFEQQKVPEGHVLVRQGDPPDCLYFLDMGQVTAQIESAQGRTVRLKTMLEGTVVGEMGLYLKQPRSASVVADMPCIIYRLSLDALNRMQQQEPQLAAAFHELMARLLAARLSEANQTIQDLLD